MIAYLRLVRAGLLLSPAADVVAGMALAGLPWSVDAVRTAAASTCVYAAGMVLNDHADRHADAVHRPERPIPSGAVPPGAALTLGVVLLAAGCALSPWPVYHGGLALLAVLYDYVLKRHVAAGALTMGVLRGANLIAGGVVVGRVAPVPLLLHAALAYAVYIVAVTLLGVLEDEPKVKVKAVVSLALLGPLAGCLALLQTPHAAAAASAGFALTVLFLFAAVRRRSFDQRAIRRVMTFLLLGTMVYTSLLCLGAGRMVEAAAVLAAALVGRAITRTIAVT
ncbi:MAG TPA: UbiA family prenyltransferase [Planctomycetota bacterium]|nr:UbiA family prenyltransferase [Planctomycetota bacterium]